MTKAKTPPPPKPTLEGRAAPHCLCPYQNVRLHVVCVCVVVGGAYIPLSTEGTFLSGSAPRGTIRAACVASLHATHVSRAERKQHTHNVHNAQNAQHGVLGADLEADFRHAQNA